MRHSHAMDHGATVIDQGRVRFRIWAPSVDALHIVLDDGDPQPMQREPADWFSAELPAQHGTRYQFVLPDGLRVPDPASRRQVEGVHGASIVVDPCRHEWHDETWQTPPWTDTILYELHPGAFGGFAGITDRLPFLASIGITAIELMPIAEFPGDRNWGYDGVLPYAPDSAYGTPEQLKHLVDTAHGLGLMVFLDVVYNHFGPDGAYIHVYAKSFFSEDFHTPWGAGIDFRRRAVQDYFIDNALYWLSEFRFDGLRFDALGAIEPQEFLQLLTHRIRDGIEPGRRVHLVMEHEHNAAGLLRGSFDAQWTDDIHHALHVLLTGETAGYYEDFADATALFARCLAEGFAFQGEISQHSGKPRGEPSADLPTSCFVAFIQNHDQIGNRATGDRLTASVPAAKLRAARAFVLLCPFIPLMFMGEEWGTKTPFQFFTDHHDELADLVRTGRRTEFGAFFGDAVETIVPDPNDIGTFHASCPDFAEAEQPGFRQELALTRHLLALRRTHINPRNADTHASGVRVLGAGAVDGSWTMQDGSVLRIGLNLGVAPAPIERCAWPVLFGTEGAAQAARDGDLPADSVIVWLSALAADAPALDLGGTP